MEIRKILLYFIYRVKYRSINCKIKYGVKINQYTELSDNVVINRECRILNTKIGRASYMGNRCILEGCIIGNFTSIGNNCEVIVGNHPTHTFVSTHPSFYSINMQSGITFVNKNIFNEYKYVDDINKISVMIGNDVWIGSGVKIMEGVTIGDGAIIGAGSLVTKDVPPYSIVGGVPAKIIKYRFSKDNVEKLMKLKWWDKDYEWIEKNADLFRDINEFLSN